jgi:hypothetical protein
VEISKDGKREDNKRRVGRERGTTVQPPLTRTAGPTLAYMHPFTSFSCHLMSFDLKPSKNMTPSGKVRGAATKREINEIDRSCIDWERKCNTPTIPRLGLLPLATL